MHQTSLNSSSISVENSPSMVNFRRSPMNGPGKIPSANASQIVINQHSGYNSTARNSFHKQHHQVSWSVRVAPQSINECTSTKSQHGTQNGFQRVKHPIQSQLSKLGVVERFNPNRQQIAQLYKTQRSLTSDTPNRGVKFGGNLKVKNTKRDRYDQMIQNQLLEGNDGNFFANASGGVNLQEIPPNTVDVNSQYNPANVNSQMYSPQQQIDFCNKLLKKRQIQTSQTNQQRNGPSQQRTQNHQYASSEFQSGTTQIGYQMDQSSNMAMSQILSSPQPTSRKDKEKRAHNSYQKYDQPIRYSQDSYKIFQQNSALEPHQVDLALQSNKDIFEKCGQTANQRAMARRQPGGNSNAGETRNLATFKNEQNASVIESPARRSPTKQTKLPQVSVSKKLNVDLPNTKVNKAAYLANSCNRNYALQPLNSEEIDKHIDNTIFGNPTDPNSASPKMKKFRVMEGRTPFEIEQPQSTYFKHQLQVKHNVQKEDLIQELSKGNSKTRGLITVRMSQQHNEPNVVNEIAPYQTYVENFVHPPVHGDFEASVHTFATKLIYKASFLKVTQIGGLSSSRVGLLEPLPNQPNNRNTSALNLPTCTVSKKESNFAIVSQGTESKTSLASKCFESEQDNLVSKTNLDSDKILNEIFNEESAMVSSIGQDFIQKMQYVDIYKKKVQLEDDGTQTTTPGIDSQINDCMSPSSQKHSLDYNSEIETKKDPRIQYYLKCKKDLNLALPILDKIVNKTLCLQNYTLSIGNCKGLALACQHFDSKKVNRIFLNNCGISPDEFKPILQGLRQIDDCKSIIYMKNDFDHGCLEELAHILANQAPNHLDELRLTSLKIKQKCTEDLIEILKVKSYLRKLSLIKLNMSDRVFISLITFIEENVYLRELDLSWSEVRLSTYESLIESLATNNRLSSLTLRWNNLLEVRKQNELTKERLVQQLKPILTPQNKQIIRNLTNFIQFNQRLVFVDLANCGFNEVAIIKIVRAVKKSVSLKSIHLGGNPGTNEGSTEKVRRILGADPHDAPRSVRLYTKPSPISEQPISPDSFLGASIDSQASPKFRIDKKNLLSQLGNAQPASKNQHKFNQVDHDRSEAEQLYNLREGIKLRNIIQSSRMIKGGLIVASSKEYVMMINRKLGYKTFINDADKWSVHTNLNQQQDWVNDSHKLVIFLWSQKIGGLVGLNEKETNHYKSQLIDLHKDEEGSMVLQADQPPNIVGQFTNWRFKKMTTLLDFIVENDPNPPNFRKQLIEDTLINSKYLDYSDDQLPEMELALLQQKRSNYYRTKWLQTILKIIPFKSPQFALIDQLTSFTLSNDLQDDETNKLYIYIDFVKPGRHVFCVKAPPVVNPYTGVNRRSKIFAHKMIANYRAETLPPYFKNMNVNTQEESREVEIFGKKCKAIINQYSEDDDQIEMLLAYDCKYIKFPQLEPEVPQQNKVRETLKNHYRLWKELLMWARSRSRSFPLVDKQAFSDLLDALKLPKMPESALDLILQESVADYIPDPPPDKLPPGQSRDPGQHALILHSSSPKFRTGKRSLLRDCSVQTPKMLRPHFIEAIMRVSCYHYAKDFGPSKHEKRVLESIKKFSREHCKKFIEAEFDGHTTFYKRFREEKIWQVDVPEEIKKNEAGIKAVMLQYDEALDKSVGKISLQDWLRFCCKDLRAQKISREVATRCFAESKMSVANELDAKMKYQLENLTYMEMSEAILRLTHYIMEESELVSLPLSKKLWYLLDPILALVEVQRCTENCNNEIPEEENEEGKESDDDSEVEPLQEGEEMEAGELEGQDENQELFDE